MNCITCSKKLIGRQTKYCSKLCKNRDTNNKLQNYETQHARATKLKIELMELLGNKCCRCGYRKNLAAIHFHHTRDKEFEIDSRHLANCNKEKLLQEVKKCILLCANCHMEEHYPNCATVNSTLTVSHTI